MAKPDPHDMTVEELEAVLLDLKTQKLAITERQRELQAIRRDKLDIYYLSQRLGIDASGITPEQAKNLLEVARQPRPGDVVVTPAPAELKAEPAGAEVSRG